MLPLRQWRATHLFRAWMVYWAALLAVAAWRPLVEYWRISRSATGRPILLPVALAAGLLAEAETLAITLVLRGWRHDVPSVWNALRVRA